MAGGEYGGASILIIDDEESNILVLERMLARAGYTRITSTRDSRETMRLVKTVEPDLILLDLMMPYLDGYGVLAQLREHASTDSYLPVLVLTADVTPGALQRALSEGARDFLTKPFDQTELLLRVHNLLETRFLYLGLLRQMEALENLNAQAQDAIIQRDASLSSISHDLGQPLAALRFTVDALESLLEDSEQIEKADVSDDLRRIDAATSQIIAMVGEMSDLARLQMGRDLVLNRYHVDLVSLAREQVALAQRSTSRHKLRLETSEVELKGEWDQIRLVRVFSNLLSNAIKFSPNGGQIVVDVRREDGTAYVSVQDEGIGIPAAEIPHVVTSFYRASNAAGRIEGSGVGLASVKQIVEQHGGSMAIESREGAGTTVRLQLPVN